MRKILRCKKCLMADTKPGVKLNAEGICQACVNHAKRADIDYTVRWIELESLCRHYKSKNSPEYDCIIPASGGKDSWIQVDIMKNKLGMNPLIVRVADPYTPTQTGIENLRNMCEHFNVDLHTITPSPHATRKITKIAFEKFGSPTWPVDRLIYAAPIKLAHKLDIPFIIYGENVSYEYGGVLKEETSSAKKQIRNDVAKDVGMETFLDKDVTVQELEIFRLPFNYQISCTDPIYLSYFMPWSGLANKASAILMGFKTLTEEWFRKGYMENYDQIDSIGYLINVWMKVPKFGFGRVTDVVGYWIRDGVLERSKGIEMIKKHDKILDPKILADFLDYTGYSHTDFREIVAKHKVYYKDELDEM